MESARAKVKRLHEAGFRLSKNDSQIIFCGQLLTTLDSADGAAEMQPLVEEEIARQEIELSESIAKPSPLVS